MDGLWQWWGTLSQGLRDTIVGGLVLIAVGGVLTIFRKSIAAGWKRLRRNNQPAQVAPPPIVIKVETPQPLPPAKEPEPSQPPTQAPHLPRPPVVGFVARRDKEGRDIVTLLKAELAPEGSQLIVLWGEGGIGKTTLAAEVARALIAVFTNRILWTSADGREDFSLSTLLDEIATQLGNADLRRLALEPKKEDVRALIDDAPSLIVLDNFETISAVEQVSCANWIADAPCPALITTRLQVNGRRNVPIDAMSKEEAREFLDRLIAQAGNLRDFKKLDQERIIQSAAANPLVMQWIIAQIGLAQRPDDVLDDLAHGEGDAAQRVFDRSFKLAQLSDDGRDVLLALSLFAPSASRLALAEVAGFGNDTKRFNEATRSLAALCLVETTDAGERLIIKGLTRELARARLHKDELSNEFCRRFIAYFLRYAEAYAEVTAEDFNALESEKDNLLSAMDIAFEMKDWKSVMGIRSALEEFLDLRGYWNEAISRGEQAAAAANALEDEYRVAIFAANVGAIRNRRGEYNEARSVYQKAYDAFNKLGSEENIAVTLHQLGFIAQNQGEIEEARRLYNESLKINKKLGNQSAIAMSLHQLAMIAQDQGEIAEARRLYDECLEIAQRLDDQSGIARTLHQLGVIAQIQGEIAEARRLYNESLEIAKRLGDQNSISITLHQLGRLAEIEGNKIEAARLFREALGIFEKLGSPDAELARRSLKRVEDESGE